MATEQPSTPHWTRCWQQSNLQLHTGQGVGNRATFNSTLDKVLATEQPSSSAERLWREKLVALGTDGAFVMLGKNNGVAAKFKTANGQYIVGVHCTAHRLELAFKDSTATDTCHKKLEELLLGLYYFYHSSALNRANLKRSFGILALRPVMPTRVGGTRWVGHIRLAIDRFLKGYAAIIQHLKQIQSPDVTGVRGDQQAKSRKFHKLATSLDIVQYACFLKDVFFHLCNLSNTLQKKDVSLAQVHSALQITRAVLVKFKEGGGSTLQQFLSSSKRGMHQHCSSSCQVQREGWINTAAVLVKFKEGDGSTLQQFLSSSKRGMHQHCSSSCQVQIEGCINTAAVLVKFKEGDGSTLQQFLSSSKRGMHQHCSSSCQVQREGWINTAAVLVKFKEGDGSTLQQFLSSSKTGMHQHCRG